MTNAELIHSFVMLPVDIPPLSSLNDFARKNFLLQNSQYFPLTSEMCSLKHTFHCKVSDPKAC